MASEENGVPISSRIGASRFRPAGSHVERLRRMMRVADNPKVGDVPEGAAILNLDDVVDVSHARAIHVACATRDRASPAIHRDGSSPELFPACRVVTGVFHYQSLEAPLAIVPR